MKLSEWLFASHSPKGGRNPQPDHTVPMREILPLQLKDRVSGKYDRNQLGGCYFELTRVIICLQNNEYEARLCAKESESLQKCYDSYIKVKKDTKEAQRKVMLVPGDRNLTFKQIKKLLKMRPIT